MVSVRYRGPGSGFEKIHYAGTNDAVLLCKLYTFINERKQALAPEEIKALRLFGRNPIRYTFRCRTAFRKGEGIHCAFY